MTTEDSNGLQLIYASTLSDGTELPSWITFNAVNLKYSGTPPFVDTYNITISASDQQGPAVTSGFVLEVIIAQPPFLATIPTPEIAEVGTDWKGSVFQCYDPSGVPLTFSWNATNAHLVSNITNLTQFRIGLQLQMLTLSNGLNSTLIAQKENAISMEHREEVILVVQIFCLVLLIPLEMLLKALLQSK